MAVPPWQKLSQSFVPEPEPGHVAATALAAKNAQTKSLWKSPAIWPLDACQSTVNERAAI